MSSVSPKLESQATSAPGPRQESLADFLNFVATNYHLQTTEQDGILHVEVDPATHATWPKPYRVDIAVTGEAAGNLKRKQLSPLDAAEWLRQRARLDVLSLALRPEAQPEAVHEISSRLFEAYTVDNGQIRLAGCHLEEVPFVRLTSLSEEDPTQVVHQFVDIAGEPVDPDFFDLHGFAVLVPVLVPPMPTLRPPVEGLIDSIDNQRLVAATVVVAKRVEGRLQFDLGDQCAWLNFAGWTSTLVPPAFKCPASGIETHHLTSLDDGRIVAAEAAGRCEVSGKRMLESDLVTCSVTGKRVDPSLTKRCPVTELPTLLDEFAACSQCKQEVSAAALDGNVCAACRSLSPVEKNSAELQPLRDKFPALAGYRRARMVETKEVTMVEVSGLWKRMLVIVRKTDGQPVVVATRGRFSSIWTDVPESNWDAVLGTSQGNAS